ncbi:MAG: GNAT family protein [Knoellia sp.]
MGRTARHGYARARPGLVCPDRRCRAGRGTLANLGWSMDPVVHGRGLATEALRAALGICFDQLGLHHVEADCFADNAPSWRLMERVGMRREGHYVKQGFHREFGWADMYAYGMLAPDWKALNRA